MRTSAKCLGFATILQLALAAAINEAQAFDCSETKCPDISSCAEARYKLEVCGQAIRDYDHDTIPCENVCGNDLEIYAERSRVGWPADVAFPDDKHAPGSILLPPAFAEPSTLPFACEGKRTCKEMITCEEAKFYLTQCGASRLDGDGDGVPCKSSVCR